MIANILGIDFTCNHYHSLTKAGQQEISLLKNYLGLLDLGINHGYNLGVSQLHPTECHG